MAEPFPGGERDSASHSDLDPLLDPDRYRPQRPPIWTMMAIIVGIGVVISVALGLLGQIGGLDQLGWSLRIGSGGESVVLVESRGDLIVMKVDRAGYEELRVLNVTSGMIEDVSHGAQQAREPALSHSGELIAYFTLRDQRTELDISEVGGTSRTLIPASEFTLLAHQKDLAELHVCPWTDIWWSRGDRYIAFFICSDAYSLVTVKDRDAGDLFTLDSTQATGEQPRTLLWLSDTEIAVVQPEKE